MITAYKDLLKDYISESALVKPILVTFTSKYPATLRGKFMLLRRWKQYRLLMTSRLPWREYHWDPIFWAMEYSENTVHIHCVAEGQTSSRVLNHSWLSLNRHDLGKVDVRPLKDYETGLEYSMKDYNHDTSRIDKFLGHFVMLKPQRLYNQTITPTIGKKRKRDQTGRFC